MKKFISACVLVAFASTPVFAVDYNYIDPGDYYYINDFGSDNRRVVVVRKLSSGMVKVRNLSTGESSNVTAASLLTQSQLQAQETENLLVGTAVTVAIFACLLSPESCE